MNRTAPVSGTDVQPAPSGVTAAGTSSQPSAADYAYQRQSLQGVSRTFALTIPSLPAKLREVVGNAYLLCRIADIVEDDDRLTHTTQRRFADEFVRVVEGSWPAERFARELHPLLSEQVPAAEQDLILNTLRVIRITHSFNHRQRQALSRCVRVMARGMTDYQGRETLAGLPDLKAVDDYCYYVAGVVGEMLTELFCDYSPAIEQRRAQLSTLALSFGQGLQMTNILKDIWEDRQRGACWLPHDLFRAHGVDLLELRPGAQAHGFREGLGRLIAIAKGHLDDALSYTLLIPPSEPGIRKFCLWALGMAVLTLRKIERHRDFSSGCEVKITRPTVHLTVALTSAVVGSDRALKALYAIAAKGLPVS